MGWKDRIRELYIDYGKDMTYQEIGEIVAKEFGVKPSDETVRYHAKRKFTDYEKQQELKEEGISKALVLFDIHVPFHREDEIINIVKKHRDEIDVIIFGGDLMDCKDISSFPVENRQPLVLEMVETYKFLKRIDRLTPNVGKIMIRGNHEDRFSKHLIKERNGLNELHTNNILQEVVSGFTYYDRTKLVRRVYEPLSDNFTLIDKWFVKYKDLIVAHPKNFSKIPVRTAVNTVNHFIARGVDFSMCLIGHTHKWGYTWNMGKFCGEVGCLCNPMDYADNGNVNYTPQSYGYAVVTFKDDKAVVQDSMFEMLHLEDGEKKWVEEKGDLS